MKTPNQSVKPVQSKQLKHHNNVTDVVLVPLLLTLNIYITHCSGVPILDFEQVNVDWIKYL